MICVQTLETKCRNIGLKFKRNTEFHYTIRGQYEVNVYPSTGRVHMKGGQRSGAARTVEEIIELARGEAAVDVGELAKRRQMTNPKRNLWRHSHICGLCKEPIDSFEEATVDHIIPIVRGGSNRFDNLQLAHEHCNSGKGCKL